MTTLPPQPVESESDENPLPPFPIPRWVMILIAMVLVLPPLYVLSFAPAANMLGVEISGRSRIKRVEITSVPKEGAERFLLCYGPVVYMVNEVPIFYPYFMSWARTWQVNLIEYQ
ncbi:MAG: hypothetical protein ACAI35_23085 [Candidatus Methylacidiphilales bacterium]|nr:hypothetical protein [Candidatus Methylacidiphilales bacterium]